MKIKLLSTIIKLFCIGFIFNYADLNAQVSFTSNPSNAQLNAVMSGPGITLTGGVLTGGATETSIRANQVAAFTNGIVGAGLQIFDGGYFSTGRASFELTSKNTATTSSYDNPTGGVNPTDVDLSSIDPGATNDLVSYVFTVTLGPSIYGLEVIYQFGSEEYPDYVGSSYNDAFGFFISGPGIVGNKNLAVLPNGNATSINKVNAGFPGASGNPPIASFDGSQSGLYINNGHTTAMTGGAFNTNTNPGPSPIHVEFNGITKLIKSSILNLVPGGTYAFKIVIADSGDSTYDSGVFIDQLKGLSLTDLAIVKTVSNSSPNVGDNVTFNLTASNSGPSLGSGIVVNDLLPSGYTFVSATPSAGSYASGTGVWSVGTLASGSNATLSIVATVKATGSYTNTATITSPDSDPTPGNNTSTVTPVPVPKSNISVVKTVNNATPDVGNNVVFTIVASNAGPSAATSVVVNDLLPSGYTYVSSTVSTGTYNSATGVWAVGNLATGASQTLTVTALVKATGSYANIANITASESDPTPGNNTSTVTPVPVPKSNISVVKTVNNATPDVGNNVVFTIVASNAGPSAATSVV
ncbi:choice-of-anchor L domain-containing protein, partial [Flavobacterium crassostreae]